jgi:hypothetical protein
MTQLYAMIRGLWLSFLMSPKTTEREALAATCLDMIAGRAEQPVRVVTSMPERPKAPPRAKPKKQNQPQQIDIEDLFANG